jgi:PKD repeat protein
VTVTGPSAALTVSAPATLTIALASSSTSGSPVVTAMHIDFGDGLGANPSPGTTSAVHFYANEGVFTVTVTVTDSTGAQSSGSATLAVGALSASATTVPSSITHGTSATFVVTPSNTAAFIDHYEWNFGDGSAVQSTSSGTNSHVYAAPGSYNIVVNVVPLAGNAISVPIAIVVS